MWAQCRLKYYLPTLGRCDFSHWLHIRHKEGGPNGSLYFTWKTPPYGSAALIGPIWVPKLAHGIGPMSIAHPMPIYSFDLLFHRNVFIIYLLHFNLMNKLHTFQAIKVFLESDTLFQKINQVVTAILIHRVYKTLRTPSYAGNVFILSGLGEY